jgi:hypothetical protein
MKKQENNYTPESAKPKQTTSNVGSIDYNLLKQMIDESVESVLRKNGVIVESTEKTNDTFTFRVGKHIFEGKISKVKKMS